MASACAAPTAGSAGDAAALDDVEFFADLAVVEHLALLMSAHGDEAPDSRAADLLGEVGLADAADQLPASWPRWR